MSPAAVVLQAGFSSSTVAVCAVFSFGSVRSLEAFCGRVDLIIRAALNVAADIIAHLEGRTRKTMKALSTHTQSVILQNYQPNYD